MRSSLGNCLTSLARYEEAEPLVLDSYQILFTTQGAESRFTRGALNHVIALYDAWGKPEQARALLFAET